MKVLLIEDNSDIAQNIIEYLKLEGYIVAWNGRGDDGFTVSQKYDFDIILLDLSLPGLDGIEICKKIRQKKDIPIIMITARESIEQRVKGLESGANDYLVKPFDLRELVARIKAVTRNTKKSPMFESGKVKIDFGVRKFFYADTEVFLSQKEFLVLESLYKNIGKIVSRTDIIEYVWGGEDELFGADGKLDVYISYLRSKFGKDFIRTVKGVGYTLRV